VVSHPQHRLSRAPLGALFLCIVADKKNARHRRAFLCILVIDLKIDGKCVGDRRRRYGGRKGHRKGRTWVPAVQRSVRAVVPAASDAGDVVDHRSRCHLYEKAGAIAGAFQKSAGAWAEAFALAAASAVAVSFSAAGVSEGCVRVAATAVVPGSVAEDR
jgi:hypothetical protein